MILFFVFSYFKPFPEPALLSPIALKGGQIKGKTRKNENEPLYLAYIFN